MSAAPHESLSRWFASLEQRHLRDLSFAEVRRALQALSALYVQRRGELPGSTALRGAGKRAAFALFYGPLHFIVTQHVAGKLGAVDPAPARILDLGCGTGAAGAAWALAAGRRPSLTGIDVHPWTVDEANRCWRFFGLDGAARRGRIERVRLPGAGAGIVLAYSANELAAEARRDLLDRLLNAADRGAAVLVIEPISRRAVPWWDEWVARFLSCGGRADAWRFTAELPERLRLLDRAAGLDHRELTARTLYRARGQVLA